MRASTTKAVISVRRFSFLSALLLAGLSSAPALANGRFPKANQLVIAPGAPDTMTLRTTFGILFSSASVARSTKRGSSTSSFDRTRLTPSSA